MATTKISYGTIDTLTVTEWDSLATADHASSDYHDNTTTLAVDAAIFGTITMGASAPTAGDTISWYLVPGFDDGAEIHWHGDLADSIQGDGDTSTDLVEGTDFFEQNLILAATYVIDNTTVSQVLGFSIPSVVAVLGVMPQYLKVILGTGDAPALAASGNECHVLPILYTST